MRTFLGPVIHRAMEGGRADFNTDFTTRTHASTSTYPFRRNGKGSSGCHQRQRKEHEEHPCKRHTDAEGSRREGSCGQCESPGKMGSCRKLSCRKMASRRRMLAHIHACVALGHAATASSQAAPVVSTGARGLVHNCLKSGCHQGLLLVTNRLKCVSQLGVRCAYACTCCVRCCLHLLNSSMHVHVRACGSRTANAPCRRPGPKR